MTEVIGFIVLDNKTSISDVVKTKEGRMFKFEVEWMISEEQAYELQANIGYPACAYGFYGFCATVKGTQWFCSCSSD